MEALRDGGQWGWWGEEKAEAAVGRLVKSLQCTPSLGVGPALSCSIWRP